MKYFKFIILEKSRYLLAGILLVAGMTHLFWPELFMRAMPGYLPNHLSLIYITGLLEIFFAIGLLIEQSLRLTALWVGLYFILLIPIHIHVAYYGIEMFGINSKPLLWLRTFLQLPLIYWCYFLYRKSKSS
jgi:uncharacterized membrane protein